MALTGSISSNPSAVLRAWAEWCEFQAWKLAKEAQVEKQALKRKRPKCR